MNLLQVYNNNPHIKGSDAYYAWRDACSQIYDKWYRYHRDDNREYDNAHIECLKYMQLVYGIVPDIKIIECN
jgi:hypothetical protein